MKTFVPNKDAFAELEKVVRENSAATGEQHAVHVIIPPIINDDGDFIATHILLLKDDSIAFGCIKKDGNPRQIEIRSLGNGHQFRAEVHPYDFATKFLGNC
ncbi:MAG: hypothetical protein HY674_19760 [Chloroflexi bacterium]|nr:hypothetical protein [Chloroflexota bacterium]